MEVDDDQSVVWGWQTFFERLSHLLQSAERHFNMASESFARYVTERIKTCLVNVRFLKEHINSFRDRAGEEDIDTEEWEALGNYADDIDEFHLCLIEMYDEWQGYLESMETGSSRLRLQTSQGYSAPLVLSSRRHRGRPRFNIGLDHVQYLSGMGFSWADVARLLGVSRMTVYRHRRDLGM